MVKKRTNKKEKCKDENKSSKDGNQMLPEVKEFAERFDQLAVRPSSEPLPEISDPGQANASNSGSSKKRLGSVRGVSALHSVVVKKAQGKKIKIKYNRFGVPTGSNRCTLQSYIGMLARSMIPIDISSWPKVDNDLKQKLWLDVLGTFKIEPESEGMVLKSAGDKWRGFKTKLTTKFVLPYKGQKKKLKKPPPQYEFVGKESWKRFVEQRTDSKWLTLSTLQSGRVRKRKYPHRLSRKGYIGLQEEEIKKGTLKRGQKPDRAIFWKKARTRKDKNAEIDEEEAKIFSRIDDLLDKKEKGEFQPSGTQDVLTTALETPEHSGRVRGVGGYVTPAMYFNLPKEKKCRITKADLLARDKKMVEELERTRQEMAELRALVNATHIHSPMVSDKSSCQPTNQEAATVKSPTAKELKVDHPPTGKLGPQLCELAVETLENTVAFGTVFDDEDMNVSVHGVPLKPGHVRVSVDGHIKPDAPVPVPVPGEIEVVREAVGSHVAWPRDLIIFPNMMKKKKVVVQPKPSNNLRRKLGSPKKVKLNKNVPKEYKFLYNYVTTHMKDSGQSVRIPCDNDVFGVAKTIYILHENLKALLEFDMIGQAAISAYMAHLQAEIKERKKDVVLQYGFFDPGATFNLNKEFENSIISCLKEGNPDRLYFLPHNHKCHWILVIIWDGDAYILNPLSQATHFFQLEKALSEALKSYNAQTGRGNKPSKIKYLLGSPKQPGGVECGYVVMRYMKDIIADKDISFTTEWAVKNRRTYTAHELDEVRLEAIQFIQDKM